MNKQLEQFLDTYDAIAKKNPGYLDADWQIRHTYKGEPVTPMALVLLEQPLKLDTENMWAVLNACDEWGDYDKELRIQLEEKARIGFWGHAKSIVRHILMEDRRA